MKQILKTVRYVCDRCGEEETLQQYSEELPENWGLRKTTSCGSTDYTRYEEYCPSCVPKIHKSERV